MTKAAGRLNVTKTSITRVFDEIEILEIPYLSKKGRARVFNCGDSRKEMWDEIQSYLRNPLLRQFELRKRILLYQEKDPDASYRNWGMSFRSGMEKQLTRCQQHCL